MSGANRAALGRSRGEQLQGALAEAYDWYARLFRAAGVSEAEERAGAEASLAAVRDWRPEVIDEFVGIASASGVDLLRAVALNARTEILALGKIASKECSTVVARVGGASSAGESGVGEDAASTERERA